MKQYSAMEKVIISALRLELCGDNLATNMRTQRSLSIANHLIILRTEPATTERDRTHNTNGTQKVVLLNSKNTIKNPMLKETTDRAWFSCLLQHPARKRRGSRRLTPEPALGLLPKVSAPLKTEVTTVWRYRNSIIIIVVVSNLGKDPEG